MRVAPRVVAVVLALSCGLLAQAGPTFDVVSIKPNKSATSGRLNVSPGGRFEWTNTTLKDLMRLAYMRFPYDAREVAGGPSWIQSEGFTVIATTDRPLQTRADGLPVDLIAMLKTLVEDRFQLKVHNEARDGAIYALVLARGDKKVGTGLRSVPDACADSIKDITAGKAQQPQPRRNGPGPCSFGGPPGRIVANAVTMTMFANLLSGSVGQPVVDRTGLTGSFDIELTFDPASAAKAAKAVPSDPTAPIAPDNTAPSVFTALQEQLGLKLEPTRGPVDVLVIDHVERPTEN